MKIYTKTGDQGKTSLLGGKRVSKGHARIETYGTIDELNAFIGVVLDKIGESDQRGVLRDVQDRLFTVGANLATDPAKGMQGKVDLKEADIVQLEKEIDAMNAELEPLQNFILPGGHEAVSFCHVARCVCRRSERLAVRLSEEEPVDLLIIKYLNRLSDYLFILSRKVGKDFDIAETKWIPRS